MHPLETRNAYSMRLEVKGIARVTDDHQTACRGYDKVIERVRGGPRSSAPHTRYGEHEGPGSQRSSLERGPAMWVFHRRNKGREELLMPLITLLARTHSSETQGPPAQCPH